MNIKYYLSAIVFLASLQAICMEKEVNELFSSNVELVIANGSIDMDSQGEESEDEIDKPTISNKEKEKEDEDHYKGEESESKLDNCANSKNGQSKESSFHRAIFRRYAC